VSRRKITVLVSAAVTAVALAVGVPTLALASPTSNSVRADATACAAAWSSAAVYTGGEMASYQGDNWTAKWWTEADTPGGAAGVWTNDGACGGTSTPPTSPPTTTPPAGGSCSYPAWVAGTNYVTGNIVEYTANGQYYQASHDNPGYDPTISTWYWNPYTCTGGGNPPPSSGFVVSQAQFNQMFPNANPFYTYSGLVAALSSYPGFATTGSATVQAQEAAAFLANVDHETGGLVYIDEIDQSGDYCASESYGCPAGSNEYFGRGPIQLSWNFNYEAAGQALGVDLLDNPNLVATNAAISWETGLWYWDTQTGGASMTAHQAMTSGAGFGVTIDAINDIECNGGDTAEMQDRVNDYEAFTAILGVPAGSNLTC
jgi:chitodextrinase